MKIKHQKCGASRGRSQQLRVAVGRGPEPSFPPIISSKELVRKGARALQDGSVAAKLYKSVPQYRLLSQIFENRLYHRGEKVEIMKKLGLRSTCFEVALVRGIGLYMDGVECSRIWTRPGGRMRFFQEIGIAAPQRVV